MGVMGWHFVRVAESGQVKFSSGEGNTAGDLSNGQTKKQTRKNMLTILQNFGGAL